MVSSPVDLKLAYWTWVWLNTSAAVTCAFVGWRHVRRGAVERHRRWMTTALTLIVVFLVTYPFKVIFLGREQLELWSPAAVLVLRIHETIVLVMVVAGTAARLLARRLPGDPSAAAPAVRKRHRQAGKTAIVASVLAVLTATVVLVGMYLRA